MLQRAAGRISSRANRDFLSAWDGWHIEADEYRELDAERVLVLAHMTGRGKASGLEPTQMGRWVQTYSTCATAE